MNSATLYRPGLEVEVATKRLERMVDVREPQQAIRLYRRPDGSIKNG